MWGFTTPDRTIYRVDTSRGKDVVFDVLGAHFGGTLISDCLASLGATCHQRGTNLVTHLMPHLFLAPQAG